MAFKGTHNLKDGCKYLLKDNCLSRTNMDSRWPKKFEDLNEVQQLHRRLGEDENLYTKGMNIVLMWSTGSDLDINVMCGCGKWHGYGTSGGSEGSCYCNVCHMSRDKDV